MKIISCFVIRNRTNENDLAYNPLPQKIFGSFGNQTITINSNF